MERSESPTSIESNSQVDVGDLALATEVANCTSSCTDGDISCCNGLSLELFRYSPNPL